ncbi:MAG: alpha/beta hydrolase [Archangiaceae bacterium]|nr:alpha/beta hydrolase [Archangiaceae bacterium]
MNVRIDGFNLAYRSSGSGQPVLLLHAFPLTSEGFWPQLDAPPAGARLICPDHRGFGSSSLRPGVSTMEALANDALKLLDALKIDQAIVGGVSMGGYAAMALTRLDPSRVKALILMDTHPLPDDAAGREKREAVAKDFEKNGMGNFVPGALESLLAKTAKPYVRARVDGIMRSVNPLAAAAASRGMAARDDSREILGRFTGPALVLGGAEDALSSPQRMGEMAALMPKARHVVIAGAGHLANLEAPQEVNAALAEFIAGVQ